MSLMNVLKDKPITKEIFLTISAPVWFPIALVLLIPTFIFGGIIYLCFRVYEEWSK